MVSELSAFCSESITSASHLLRNSKIKVIGRVMTRQGGFLVSERPSEKYYRDTARFYDSFAEKPDENLYLDLAERFGSPILELACGTGRITLTLAQAGYEITGIELSPEMLEIAQGKLRQLPEDVQAQAQKIAFKSLIYENPYDLGYMEQMKGFPGKYKIRPGHIGSI